MDIRYCALITDESRSQIWAIDATLPRLMISKPFWWQEVRPVNEAAGEQLGAGLTTLNCFRILGGEATVGSRLYYALELPPDTSALKAGRWRAVDELESIEERDIAAEWLAQLSSITVPWYQPGWRAEALAWAEVQLRERGFLPLRTSEQVRSWERSSLWQFNTTAGRFFFKAVSAAFAGEPALTRQLAQWQPEQVAPIVALDEPHGWLILGEAGDKSLLREQDATRWQAALSCYAELQMALAPRTNELLALGLPDRRVEHLPAWIEALLANTGALTNSPAGLSADEIERLRAQRPSVQAACARLANCPIPASLEHGDFAPGQVVYDSAAKYRFIDWSDAGLSFPFFSFQFFWAELGDEFADPLVVRQNLREAYLSPWTSFSPMETLKGWLEDALQVAPFYYALIYHREILPKMSAKWEMERMLPYYLRLALKAKNTI